MTHEVLKTRIRESIPFILPMADGRSYPVPHQDFIWLPPRATSVVVAVPDEENPDVYVSHTIPLLMVSGVEEKTKLESP